MKRTPKIVYAKDFREEAVKRVMTGGLTYWRPAVHRLSI
jgi:hypothetical protein